MDGRWAGKGTGWVGRVLRWMGDVRAREQDGWGRSRLITSLDLAFHLESSNDTCRAVDAGDLMVNPSN